MLIQTVIVVLDKEARDVAIAALTTSDKGFVEFSTLVDYEDFEGTLCGPEYNSVIVNSNGIGDNVIEFPPPRPRDVL
jgi:hypothetical protein